MKKLDIFKEAVIFQLKAIVTNNFVPSIVNRLAVNVTEEKAKGKDLYKFSVVITEKDVKKNNNRAVGETN